MTLRILPLEQLPRGARTVVRVADQEVADTNPPLRRAKNLVEWVKMGRTKTRPP